jgi:arsenate reductase
MVTFMGDRMIAKKPVVLILCTGNSCRSQMAEGFLRKYHGDRYDAASAGTDPKPEIHPLAVRVMNEVGINIAGQRPESITNYLGRSPVRHLVVVCDKANATCPRIWPGTFSRDYMPFDDPAEAVGTEDERLDIFRRVRDEISDAIKAWTPASPLVEKR